MRRYFPGHLLLAALIVITSGIAFAALPETKTIKVMKSGDEEIKIKVDGTTEIITLDDLADGEERTISTGENEIVVKREGDQLTMTMDGDDLHGHHGSFARSMVWVTDDDESEDGDHRVIVIKSDHDGEHGAMTYKYDVDVDIDEEGEVAKIIELNLSQHLEELDLEGLEALKELEDLDIKIGKPIKVQIHDGHHMFITSGDDDKVRFRCAESGSELVVNAEDVTSDTYICPVTGCVMERVEEPEMRVIKVHVSDDDEEDEDE